MEEKLTVQFQEWLNAPAEKRDVATGAMLVRRMTHNLLLAGNYERFPKRFGPMVEYQLSKYLPMRLAKKTHEDVVRMSAEVEKITKPIPNMPGICLKGVMGQYDSSDKKEAEKYRECGFSVFISPFFRVKIQKQ